MLNAAKFDLIDKMGERLPVAPYKHERTILDREKAPYTNATRALSFVQQTVPFAFIALNIGLFITEL
jgi:hypothetical protein